MTKVKDNSSSGRYIAALSACAVLLVMVTLLSIDWHGKNKILGDEYTCHIYGYDTFKLLSVAYLDDWQLVCFNPDKHYNDEFTFEYDPSSEAYIIYKNDRDVRIYLFVNEDNELEFGESSDVEGSRWYVNRYGNTMYYFIVNTSTGLALSQIDTYHTGLLPVDESDTQIYMRFE